ncbi:sodium:solute symporter family transporter [Aeoliella sp.]|uniref:sodium:solute symporter family transporter n=1 Tax=Aeoliella sp. TaxID=2795800 RepID=UPI003CCB7B36
MSSADYIVLLLYLAGMVAIGLFFARQNKDAAQMFAAGGQSPWWTSGLSAFMTMFSAGTFVVWGGIAFRLGVVAIAINLCYGVAALLVGVFVAGKWKDLGILTPAEYIELRFSRTALHFYTWWMMFYRVVNGGVALYAMCILLVQSMVLAEGHPLRDPATGNLSLTWAIVISGGVVVVYTMMGGLWGVLMTDVIQFIVLNLAVVFLVVVALSQQTNWTSFVDESPDGFFWPLAPDAGYAWYFLIGWIVLHFFMIGAEWAYVQRYLCVSSSADSQRSAYLFGVLYLVSPFLWLLPPLIHRLQNPVPIGIGVEELNALSERAYIDSCLSLLPDGMVGLMIAAMFSATASMMSSQLNVFAGVLTNDIYRPLAGPNVSQRRLVWAGRLFTFGIGILFVAVALGVPRLGGAEKVVIAVTSLVVVPLLAPSLWGLFSSRVNQSGVWWTTGVSVAVAAVVKFGCVSGGWLSGGQVFDSTIALLASHEKVMDLLLGVLVPIVVLLLLQTLSRKTSVGWVRLSLAAEKLNLQQPLTNHNQTPARTVAWSLIVCGGMMAMLALYDTEGQFILTSFAAALLGVGIILLSTITLLRRGVPRENTHANL